MPTNKQSAIWGLALAWVGLMLGGAAGCEAIPTVAPLNLGVTEANLEFGGLPPALTRAAWATPAPLTTLTFDPLTASRWCVQTSLNLRPTPGTAEPELTVMPPGTELTWTGQKVTDTTGLTDDAGQSLVWYAVQTETGQAGWAAAAYLNAGECPPVFVQAPVFGGYTWLDNGGTHYGIDFSPPAGGDKQLYSRFADEVIAYDGCPDCPDNADRNSYAAADPTARDYNYGYGALTVIEYAYADLSAADRAALQAEGVSLASDQSLYVLVGHVDPAGTYTAPGTKLSAGAAVATLGNSGNSSALHGHMEAAVNASGLAPGMNEAMVDFWYTEVVERDLTSDPPDWRGNRVDPTDMVTP